MSKKALIAIVSQISIIIIVFCSLLIIPSAIKNQKESKYKLLNSHMIIEDFSNRIDTIEEFNEYTKNNQRYINAITGKTISNIYPFFISTIYIDSTMYKYRSGYQIIVTDDFDQLCSIYKNGYSEKTEINSEPGVYVSSSLYFLNNCSSLNGYGDFDDKTPSYYLNVSGYYQEDKNDVNKGDKYIVMSFDYYLNNDISKYLECSYSGCVYKCNEEVLYSDISKINTNDILDLMCKDSLIYEELESYQPIFNVSRILLFLSIMIISINCIVIIWQNNVLEKENNYILYVYYQKPISI